ncbi:MULTISPECIES: prepilin-type N-terminal cleavage/methylation domain-containing protein [Halobacteriovorax]|uniref:Prepilin-type N-terminal cleavage/methylation domain-containing protein n=1 Tax=Halobacteriovorax vibrionivorans TaxID=2152716 RepID=A0ABY0IDR4_9BACT|nr:MULTISPECIES: prepilin-type N-terminal cleavage/methylation domain-containing protein [Halobacteriovorax]AYF45037.1 prepilin-type cleavage/methylation N-terminal domain protein [Halobacteriovorax sp. BALOs_7]RZF21101.1 prepilin-type N-terminal cleavage/methylation domain-containing protein [Halobacteriovorax vibrionivorans]TGD47013.1 prepilin-type N-terminal cleavage/methylation domain-containing protein [Halobacteriovorax sp. Y22]
MVKQLKNNSGFTLIEVLIGLAIFAVFITAYITAQGLNITDSIEMRSEITLREYAVKKVNEIVAYPPELKESLTLKAETGKFEENENISYSVEWNKFIVPDYEKITGQETPEDGDDSNNSIQKQIFSVVKDNLEKLIWQVRVTVKDETTEESFSLSTWISNEKYKVQINGL